MESETHTLELESLVGLFYPSIDELGDFQPVAGEQLPEPQRSLLDHQHHMTVTIEKFHSSPVNVVVMRESRMEQIYCREICLQRVSDRQTVQYGIVRLNLEHLPAPVQQEILDHQKPLGRVLIEHDVLRRVRLVSLLKIVATGNLMGLLGFANGTEPAEFFGRTAIIYCNNEPAIELLEIVRV